jgi:hypothetical protein
MKSDDYFASQEKARAYIRAHDERARQLARMPKKALQFDFGTALRQRGMERLYGKSSKDELIADSLALEFPYISEARTAYADFAAATPEPASDDIASIASDDIGNTLAWHRAEGRIRNFSRTLDSWNVTMTNHEMTGWMTGREAVAFCHGLASAAQAARGLVATRDTVERAYLWGRDGMGTDAFRKALSEALQETGTDDIALAAVLTEDLIAGGREARDAFDAGRQARLAHEAGQAYEASLRAAGRRDQPPGTCAGGSPDGWAEMNRLPGTAGKD